MTDMQKIRKLNMIVWVIFWSSMIFAYFS